MSQLVIVGDTHCHFDLLEAMVARELAAEPSTSGVLHVGDLGLYDAGSLSRLPARERHLVQKHGSPIHLAFEVLAGERTLPLPLLGIPGNHEDFTLVERLEQGSLDLPNLGLLSPGSSIDLALGSRTLRVAGLGRIAPSLEARKAKRKAKYFGREDVDGAIARLQGARPDVLLLHDPPLLRVAGQQGTFGSAWLSELVRQVRPGLVLCGHMHFEYRAELDRVPIVGLGYGARGRYGVLTEEFCFEFRDLEDRPPAPRIVEPAPEREGAGAPLASRARLHRAPLPIGARQIAERFGLGKLRRRSRRALDGILVRLRAELVARGELSEDEAWALVEPWVAEAFGTQE